MTFHIRVSGPWYEAQADKPGYHPVAIRVGGVWRSARWVKIRVGGAWRDSGYFGKPDSPRLLSVNQWADGPTVNDFHYVICTWEPPYIGTDAVVTGSENAGRGIVTAAGGPGGIKYYRIKIYNAYNAGEVWVDQLMSNCPGDVFAPGHPLYQRWYYQLGGQMAGQRQVWEVYSVSSLYSLESVPIRLGIQMGNVGIHNSTFTP